MRDAEALILSFARETLALDCAKVVLRTDEYSLNSVSGVLILNNPFLGQDQVFFKYHHEEDEGKGVQEYYNSKLLEEKGYPVDIPLLARSILGEQILLYRVRTDPRLADICREIENDNPSIFTFSEIVDAQRKLDRIIGEKYIESLHPVARDEAGRVALHQLFFYRLVDDDGHCLNFPGGRFKSYYHEQLFQFPGLPNPLEWKQLARLRWRINGRLFNYGLGELFQMARETLSPANLSNPTAAVVGHGDAHNANIWIERHSNENRLIYFDPAFASAHLPALLAEIKATFHNIFAHPDWLYHPNIAGTKFAADVRVSGDILEVNTDWELSKLRRAFLDSKLEFVWQPLIRELRRTVPQFSDSNWQAYIRLALFCCPTLVMNLRAMPCGHQPVTSVIGLSIAVMCGSTNRHRDDVISQMIQAME